MGIVTTILGAIFISLILLVILIVILQTFNIENIKDKRFWICFVLLITCAILFSCYQDNIRNNGLKEVIDNSNTIEELKETLIDREFFDKI